MTKVEIFFYLFLMSYVSNFIIVSGITYMAKKFRDDRKDLAFISIIAASLFTGISLSFFEPLKLGLINATEKIAIFGDPIQVIIDIMFYILFALAITYYLNSNRTSYKSDINLGLVTALILSITDITIASLGTGYTMIPWGKFLPHVIAYLVAFPISIIGVRKSFKERGMHAIYWSFFTSAIMSAIIVLVDYMPFAITP